MPVGLSMLSIEERALFTAPRVDRQHCPDQINFPPSLPRCSDPVWPLRRPIPLWAPFASRACVSAVRSFSPTAGNFAVRPTARPTKHRLPHATTAIIERERARAPRNSTGGRRARRRCLPRRAHTHSPTSSAAAAAGRRKGSAILSDGHTDGRCSPIP